MGDGHVPNRPHQLYSSFSPLTIKLTEEGKQLPVIVHCPQCGADQRTHLPDTKLDSRLSFVTSLAKIGVWELDLASNAFLCDATTFEIVGLPRTVQMAPMPYAKWSPAVHHSDLPAVETTLQKVIDEKSRGSSEFRMILADGAVRIVSVVASAVLDENANVSSVRGIIQDITEPKRVEQDLRERHERLKLALRSSDIGLWDWDLGTNAVYHSPEWKRQLGYKDHEMPNLVEEWESRLHPQDREVVMASMRALQKDGGGRFEEEYRLRHKDGSYRWFLGVGEVQLDSAGKPYRVAGAQMDISKRKHAESALRESEALYHNLFELSREALMTSEPPTWAFTSANPAAVRMFKAEDEEDFISHQPWDLSPERQPDGRESGEKAREMIEAAMREGSQFFEWKHRRLDGEEFFADVLLTRMKIGEKTIIQGTVRDITERIEAEKRSMLWSKVLEHSTEGIIICDLQGQIVVANKAFERLTGFSADEVVGKTPRILQSGRQNRAFYADMWKSILETGSWRGELWNRRKTGELYAEWLSISAVYDNHGALTYYVGIFSDITSQKQDVERIVHLANYDALTDLPNRVLLVDRLKQHIKVAERRKSKVAAFFIDLDRFKEVNDSLGHDAGDLLLQAVAKRLSIEVRDEDTVARLGGDEFVVVFPGIDHVQDLAVRANNLLSCLAEPVTLNGYELHSHGEYGHLSLS